MNIRCRKIDCKFNHAGACHAHEVKVCRNANCTTYQKEHGKVDLELASELAPTKPHNVPLACTMGSCLYNHDCRCAANGIAVVDNEDTNQADCATFIER
ncbi:MAG: DUF1540 domain-containing protein [Eubacteriales bacterium]|nr:DUF1540 domain-containing protein [Eubacteriales bacterium]